jgi:hypothetical protein
VALLSKWKTDVGQLLKGKAFFLFFFKGDIDDDDDVNPKQQ